MSERNYLKLLDKVLKKGIKTLDRTNTGTIATFGEQMRFDLSKGFPLITTKKVHWKSVVIELLWFMRGETNIKMLQKHNVRIWNEWADPEGNLGPVYGKQWRSWSSVKFAKFGTDDSKLKARGYHSLGVSSTLSLESPHSVMVKEIDQLKEVIERIKTNPSCRRLIVSSWNPSDIAEMALPPCHSFFQFDTTGGKLNLQLYQRSADLFLGIPFNIASYSLLLHLVANECGLQVGDFVHTIGNAHIYSDHVEQVQTQLQRVPYKLPKIKINLKEGELLDFIDSCDELDWDQIKEKIKISNYKSHEKIAGKVSV